MDLSKTPVCHDLTDVKHPGAACLIWDVEITSLEVDPIWFLPPSADGRSTERFINKDEVVVHVKGSIDGVPLSSFVKRTGIFTLMCGVEIVRYQGMLYVRKPGNVSSDWCPIDSRVKVDLLTN